MEATCPCDSGCIERLCEEKNAAFISAKLNNIGNSIHLRFGSSIGLFHELFRKDIYWTVALAIADLMGGKGLVLLIVW